MFDMQLIQGNAVIKFDDGKANAIDLDFLKNLNSAMDFATEQGAKNLVIRGRQKYFCAGLNLKKLPLLSADELQTFSIMFAEVMLRLFALPIPTIAVVEGHALAGGSVLLLCCDYRIGINSPMKIGLNEIQISMPLPTFCLDIASASINAANMQYAVLEGNSFAPSDAHKVNYLTDLVEASELEDALQRRITLNHRMGREAYAITKSRLRQPIFEEGVATCRKEFEATSPHRK